MNPGSYARVLDYSAAMSRSGDRSWAVHPDYPRDLYSGKATYYARYRVPYPTRLIEHLRDRVRPTGHARLLDLACGTGEVALPLSPWFSEVWAIDQEPDMVEMGRIKAADAGVGNVRWLVGRAEELTASPESFELISVGNAFHRLDRPAVLERALDWLPPGRFLALLWSSSLWSGNEEWQSIVAEVVHVWTAESDKPANPATPATRATGDTAATPGTTRDTASAPRRTHREVPGDFGFQAIEEHSFPTPHTWTIETLLGYLYSTAVISRAALGDSVATFESALRDALHEYDPRGRYPETVSHGYLLARRPG
jgi:SAM-dependent methyltransferase